MIELFLWIVMITFVVGVPWLCLQSTHKREKDYEKRHGHKETHYYNVKRGMYMRIDGSDE